MVQLLWCFFCLKARFGTRLTYREGRIFYQISGLCLHLREHRWLGFLDAVLRLKGPFFKLGKFDFLNFDLMIHHQVEVRILGCSWREVIEGRCTPPIQVGWSDSLLSSFICAFLKNIRNSLKLMGCTIPNGSEWRSLFSIPFFPQVGCSVAKNHHLLENSLESSCRLKGTCSFDESVFKSNHDWEGICRNLAILWSCWCCFMFPFTWRPLCAGLFCGLQCCLRLLEGWRVPWVKDRVMYGT